MGGKGYSIRIPPEPELCGEFLPSDKSSQRVMVKKEGQRRDERIGGRRRTLTQSCLKEPECFVKNGLLCNGHLSFTKLVSLNLSFKDPKLQKMAFGFLPCNLYKHILHVRIWNA